MFSLPALGKPAPSTHRRLRVKSSEVATNAENVPPLPSTERRLSQPSSVSQEMPSGSSTSRTTTLPQIRATRARLEAEESVLEASREQDACYAEYYLQRHLLAESESNRRRRLDKEAKASLHSCVTIEVSNLIRQEAQRRFDVMNDETSAFLGVLSDASTALPMALQPDKPRRTKGARRSSRGEASQREQRFHAAVILQVLLRRPMQLATAFRQQLRPSEEMDRVAIAHAEFNERVAMARLFELQQVQVIETTVRRRVQRELEDAHRQLRLTTLMGTTVAAVEPYHRRALLHDQDKCRLLVAEEQSRQLLEVVYSIKASVMQNTIARFLPAPHRLEAVLKIQRSSRALIECGTLKAALRIPMPPPRYARVTAAQLRSQIGRLDAEDCDPPRLLTPELALHCESLARDRLHERETKARYRLSRLFWLDLAHRTAPVVASEALTRQQLLREEAFELLRVALAVEESKSRVFLNELEAVRREFHWDAFRHGAMYADAAWFIHNTLFARTWGEGQKDASFVSSPHCEWVATERSLTSPMSPQGTSTRMRFGSRQSVIAVEESGDTAFIRHLVGAVSQLSMTGRSSTAVLSPSRWREELSSNAERDKVVAAATEVLAKAKTPKPPGGSRLAHSRLSISPAVLHGDEGGAAPTSRVVMPRRLSFEPSVTNADDDPPLSQYIRPPEHQQHHHRGARTDSSLADVQALEISQFLVSHSGSLHVMKLEWAEASARSALIREAEHWWDQNEVPYNVLFNPRAAQEWFGYDPPTDSLEEREQSDAVMNARESYLCEVAIIAEWERVAREHVMEDYNQDSRRIAQALATATRQRAARLMKIQRGDTDEHNGVASQAEELFVAEDAARLSIVNDYEKVKSRHTAAWEAMREVVSQLEETMTARKLSHFADPLQAVVKLQRWWKQELSASNGCFGQQRRLGKLVTDASRTLSASLRKFELLERKQLRDDLRALNLDLMLSTSNRRLQTTTLDAYVDKVAAAEASRRATIAVCEGLAYLSIEKTRNDERLRLQQSQRQLAIGFLGAPAPLVQLQLWWRRVLRLKMTVRSACIRQLLRQIHRTYTARRAKLVIPFTQFAAAVLRPRFTGGWFGLPSVRDRARTGIGCVLASADHSPTSPPGDRYGLELLYSAQRVPTKATYTDNVTSIDFQRGIARAVMASVALTEAELRTVVEDDERDELATIQQEFEDGPAPQDVAADSRGTQKFLLLHASAPTQKSGRPVADPLVEALDRQEGAGRCAIEFQRLTQVNLPATQVAEVLSRSAIEAAEKATWSGLCADQGPSYQRLCLSVQEYLRKVAQGGDALLLLRSDAELVVLEEAAISSRVLADRDAFELRRAELLVDCIARPAFRLSLLRDRSEVAHRTLVETMEMVEWKELLLHRSGARPDTKCT